MTVVTVKINFLKFMFSWYVFQCSLVPCRIWALQRTCVYVEHIEQLIGKKVNMSSIGCIQTDTCRKTFNISYIGVLPYSIPKPGEKYKTVEDILTKCCGTCVKFKEVNAFSNITEVSQSSLSNSDFVFPVLGTSTTKELYGFYYLPYIYAPKTLYITRITDGVLFSTILSLYPMVVVALLLAVISGFIAWVLETWSNRAEFPREFLTGWFEGFWWSFISMTTVGYGDKTPRSVLARLFSVIWILVGIVSFGILTGEITGQIVKTNNPPPAEMNGLKVGALRYRDYDAHVVIENGGIVTWNEGVADFQSDILQLISKLQQKQLDGILLDKWTLLYVNFILPFIEASTKDATLKDTIEFFKKGTVRTEKSFARQKLTYGILVRNSSDYLYFKDFIKDTGLRQQAGGEYVWNQSKRDMTKRNKGAFYSTSSILFSPSKRYFRGTMITVGVITFLILVFGFVYERRRIAESNVNVGESS